VKPAPPSGNYSEELEHLLEAAVKSHLAADVPVGAFLSGGWDSSLVAVLAARHTSRLRTFSIVFPEHPDLDETRWSRLVAGVIGSEHEEVEFRSADMPRLARQVVHSVEDLTNTSPAPVLYALAAHAAPHVKAVLSGEGSDEMFAGYPWLQNNWVYGVRRIAPAAPFHALAPYAGGGRLGRLMRVVGAPSDDVADREWRRSSTAATIRNLLACFSNSGTELAPLTLSPETRASCTDALQRRLGIEFTKRLADGLFLVVDKMTMAHSLEARMPFVDRSIVDFALALPSNWKIRGRQEKYVLKGTTHLLPTELAQRRKQGLRNPSPMTSPQSRAWVRDVLLEGGKRSGLFHLAALEPWLSQIGRRRSPAHETAWSLVNLQLWWECFFAEGAK
jgi:asparagine synthase (glutamine-hydrolysing)